MNCKCFMAWNGVQRNGVKNLGYLELVVIIDCIDGGFLLQIPERLLCH